MFDGTFRKPVDKAVKPLGALLRKTRLTPDHLTIMGLLVGIAAAVAIGFGRLWVGLGPSFWLRSPISLMGHWPKLQEPPANGAHSSTRRSIASPTHCCLEVLAGISRSPKIPVLCCFRSQWRRYRR